jgi:hypothetical protein
VETPQLSKVALTIGGVWGMGVSGDEGGLLCDEGEILGDEGELLFLIES